MSNHKMRGVLLAAFEAHKARIAKAMIGGGEGPRVRQILERVRFSDFEAGWQASREALVIELPNRFSEEYQDYFDDVEGGCFNEFKYINDLQKVIEAAGVKVKP